MANAVDLKAVVKHIVDGTFRESLCWVCLLPLGDVCENIFTIVGMEDKEYCIASVLEQMFQMQFSEQDEYNVCTDCFLAASAAYKFYLLTKRSNEILNFYVEELERNVYSIEMPESMSNDSLCITLPMIVTETQNFDYDIKECTNKFYQDITYTNVEKDNATDKRKQQDSNVKIKKEIEELERVENIKVENEDENVVVVVKENGKSLFYAVKSDNTLELITMKENTKIIRTNSPPHPEKVKMRRKRDPMTYKKCSACPVKYRFIAKLKEHMKVEHDIDLYVCKICKALIIDEKEFNNHLKTHTNLHRCAICDTVFKKRDTIIAHLKWHEEIKNMSKLEGAHVCEQCGVILPNEEQLKDHYDKKHDKKYTCFYCGRMYRGELSFEMHIKKHEMHLKPGEKRHHLNIRPDKEPRQPAKKAKRLVCSTCGHNFVDERALMWHTMLHTNERPYACDVCGRGFVSVNRRNQHAVCAHTVPTRRCPLCPALFHLRSMVNTHIKKVHLKAHKRRNRTSKHLNVFWRTEPVPIQELSVSIQNEILELQTREHLESTGSADPSDIMWMSP